LFFGVVAAKAGTLIGGARPASDSERLKTEAFYFNASGISISRSSDSVISSESPIAAGGHTGVP